jgi:hypothetical protein
MTIFEIFGFFAQIAIFTGYIWRTISAMHIIKQDCCFHIFSTLGKKVAKKYLFSIKNQRLPAKMN